MCCLNPPFLPSSRSPPYFFTGTSAKSVSCHPPSLGDTVHKMELDDSVLAHASISVKLKNTKTELLTLLEKVVDLLASDKVTDIQALPEVCRRTPVGSLGGRLTVEIPSSVPQFVTCATKPLRRLGLWPC